MMKQNTMDKICEKQQRIITSKDKTLQILTIDFFINALKVLD